MQTSKPGRRPWPRAAEWEAQLCSRRASSDTSDNPPRQQQPVTPQVSAPQTVTFKDNDKYDCRYTRTTPASVSESKLLTGTWGGEWLLVAISNLQCAQPANKNLTLSLMKLLSLASLSGYQSFHKVSTKAIKETIPTRLPAWKERNFPLRGCWKGCLSFLLCACCMWALKWAYGKNRFLATGMSHQRGPTHWAL